MTEIDRKALQARIRETRDNLAKIALGQPASRPDGEVFAAALLALHQRLDGIEKDLEQVRELKSHLDRIVADDHAEFRRGEHYRNRR